MTDAKRIKAQLYARCLAYVEQRIETARSSMEAAQEAANSETKSSAGDKYETGRAMAQRERDMSAAQLAEALKLKKDLEQINVEAVYELVQRGSLVITDQGNFFISISAGKISLDGVDYFAISLASPIGTGLINRKVGEEIRFNNRWYRINDVG
ncbi:3-oxoacyl-ACP synthase [Nibrella saemangeumensis]